MTPEFFLAYPLRGALSLLLPVMDSAEARAMVIAICLQESKLVARKQLNGPARGYAQFEQGGGVTGVLTHPATMAQTKVVCAALDVAPTTTGIYNALEENDILVAALARLLLRTIPDPLPGKDNPEIGWQQYVAAWRPGKPHRETWNVNFAHAWAVVEAGTVAVDGPAKHAADVLKAAVTFIEDLDKLKALVVVTPPAVA